MNIYQDWTPVDIGNKSLNKKPSFTSQKAKKEAEYDGTPPTVLYWTQELIVSLQQLRMAKNISQKELARQLNLPSSTITDIESNKSVYNPTLYRKIYKYLGGNPSSLNFPKAK